MATRLFRWTAERARRRVREILPGGRIAVTPSLFPGTPGIDRFQAVDRHGTIVAQAKTLDLLMEHLADTGRGAA